jgi:hypothetical protein
MLMLSSLTKKSQSIEDVPQELEETGGDQPQESHLLLCINLQWSGQKGQGHL